MDRFVPSQALMREYREMGFARHQIIEAWADCRQNEYIFKETLRKIRFRDQLRSEQRVVWSGNKRGPIKRISNQMQLKRLSTTNYLQGEEYKTMRKKGGLLKKEYRGMRGLSLEYGGKGSLGNKDIQRLAKEMKGYLRRLRHLSIKLDFSPGSTISIVPLLKSIKHSFACLKKLCSFARLFACLKPTLKHLDLDFANNEKSGINFPEALGQLIMRNLPKLEILCLNFRNTEFPISIVRFFINKACHHMARLRSLSLQMENCVLDDEWYISQTSLRNNLQYLKLDFDRCVYVWNRYLLLLQEEITLACPELKELFIRIPKDHIYSDDFLSTMKEEFLKKLNLKKFSLELSHELESTWNHYQDVQALEIAEEIKMEELACQFKQKGQGEEEFLLYCEILVDEEEGEELLYEDLNEDLAIDDIQRFKDEIEYLRKHYERELIEEQEEDERVVNEGLMKDVEEKWEVLDEMDEMWDWYEEEKMYYAKEKSGKSMK